MISIDNTDALDYRNEASNTLEAVVTFEYDAEANTLAIEDETDYDEGDSRKSLNIEVFDAFGKKKDAQLTAAGTEGHTDDVVIDVSDLNASEGLSVNVTLVSDKGKVKDGSMQGIGSVKTTGNITMEK